jgi:hypothetical protein
MLHFGIMNAAMKRIGLAVLLVLLLAGAPVAEAGDVALCGFRGGPCCNIPNTPPCFEFEFLA